MRYFKFPKWLKRFYPNAIWDFFPASTNATKATIYLTFDDGPNPKSTKWILDLLDSYNAKASFFCVGENVKKNPDLYASLIANGHVIGNHSFSHLNGAYTDTKKYIADIKKAEKFIDSKLFRPPYGKMKPKQYNKLKQMGFTTVFWSHISYDFDSKFEPEKRIETTLKRVKNGSIVVFHDSDKTFAQLKIELPLIMDVWKQKGFQFLAIPIR